MGIKLGQDCRCPEYRERIAELEALNADYLAQINDAPVYQDHAVERARAEERKRLLPIISRLLEAYNDGYDLSGDEIEDVYRALGDE